MSKISENKIILEIIKNVVKNRKSSLHSPTFNNLEIKHLKKCIKSTFVSTSGKVVDEFAKKIKFFTKAKFVIPVVSGTAGLHLSLKAIKLRANDEVLIPALNFIASTNTVIYENAVPHFVDIDKNHLSIDLNKLENYLKKITKFKNGKLINKITNRQIKCLITTHVFGHIEEITELKKICKKYKLVLVEDAAEALGSFYNSKHAGTFGKIGVLSFNGNKTITTGGGGAVLTDDKKIADEIYFLSRVAKNSNKTFPGYEKVGFNYRMPALNASLGIAQMEKLRKILIKKKRLFNDYKDSFKKIKEISLIDSPKNCKSNYWLNAIKFKKIKKNKFSNLIKFLKKNKVEVRPIWTPVNLGKFYKKYPKMNLKNAIKIYNKVLCIPSGVDIK